MKIALLATGDEITNGDILNTNGQIIAQSLFDAGFKLGMHLAVADDESQMCQAIRFLQKHHEVIITTGGLGPTSDDRTRFALAKACDKKLLFDDASWQAIVNRLKRFNLIPHEANKQQAYFPNDAKILPNPDGTANGCQFEHAGTLFFMLPGPPKECLPMFFQAVLPFLQTHHQTTKLVQKKWRLFGVSEGEIAAELDKLTEGFAVTTGYRWDYPYLEFKLLHDANDTMTELENRLESRLQPHIICDDKSTAFEIWLDRLNQISSPLKIYDVATNGLLQHKLWLCERMDRVIFTNETDAQIKITGLDELNLAENDAAFTHLYLHGDYNGRSLNDKKAIAYRNRRVVNYAIEYIAHKLNSIMA